MGGLFGPGFESRQLHKISLVFELLARGGLGISDRSMLKPKHQTDFVPNYSNSNLVFLYDLQK